MSSTAERDARAVSELVWDSGALRTGSSAFQGGRRRAASAKPSSSSRTRWPAVLTPRERTSSRGPRSCLLTALIKRLSCCGGRADHTLLHILGTALSSREVVETFDPFHLGGPDEVPLARAPLVRVIAQVRSEARSAEVNRTTECTKCTSAVRSTNTSLASSQGVSQTPEAGYLVRRANVGKFEANARSTTLPEESCRPCHVSGGCFVSEA